MGKFKQRLGNLKNLLASGQISRREFQRRKSKLLRLALRASKRHKRLTILREKEEAVLWRGKIHSNAMLKMKGAKPRSLQGGLPGSGKRA